MVRIYCLILTRFSLKLYDMKKLLVFFAVSITLSGWSQIISQYVETDSGTTPKGIEIWNNTGVTLDFSTNNLVIEKGTNGDTPSVDFTLSSGTLAVGKVIVIGSSDLQITTENNGSVFHSKGFSFNGDDALVVKYGGTITDIFGNPDSDPGSQWSGSGVSSANKNIALLSEITTGDTDGWTDPSERFETISSSPSSGGGIDGFGVAPTASIWTGSTSTVWSTTSNWSDNSVPTSGDIIIPDGAINNPTISTSDVVCNRLTVNSSATLTIGASASINISTINNNGVVVMQSSSTSSAALITSSKRGSGTFSYQKYVSSYSTTNDLISAPFTGLSFTNTINNNLGVIYTNPSDATQFLFGPFDNNTGSYINYDSDTDGSQVMSNAKGYRVGTQSGQTITFTGSMSVGNTGIIADQGSHETYGKWNLIGNPFPSYVDLNHFFDDHDHKLATGIVAIYAYDGDDTDGSVWTIFNSSSLTDGNGDPIQKYIAPGQAFFVAVDSQQTFTFEHDMKSVDGGDDFIASRMSQIPDTHAVITLQSDGDLSKTDLYFRPSATVGYDPSYDAGKFANESSTFDIYTKISDPLVEDINFAIQTISNDLSETVVIPLGVHISAGENHSISIDDVSLLESANVYLKDYETGALTLLNNGAYSFNSDSNLEGISRFELRLTNTTLGIESDELITNFKAIYQNDGVVLVGDFMLDDKVEIYDIMGRLTQIHTINGNHSIEISKNELATGVYLANINRKGNSSTIKFLIN